MEPHALGPVVESTLGLIRSTMDRRIEIRTRLDPTLAPVRINAATMGQVVMNLVLNARDALLDRLSQNGAGGWRPRLEITVDRTVCPSRKPEKAATDAAARAWQRLTISDNGPGMEPGIKERIFEPFFTTKSVGQGTGLGLAMVWNAATEAGGWIEVDSEPGRGTAFQLYLPEEPVPVRAQAVPREPGREVRGPEAPGITRRCLLVDDDAGVGQTVSSFLRHLGHEVVWLRQGDDALDRVCARDSNWDVFITDLNMAGVGGEALVEAARRLGFAGKIVVMSGHVTPAAEARLRAAGVQAILLKPFEYQQLKSAFDAIWT